MYVDMYVSGILKLYQKVWQHTISIVTLLGSLTNGKVDERILYISFSMRIKYSKYGSFYYQKLYLDSLVVEIVRHSPATVQKYYIPQ